MPEEAKPAANRRVLSGMRPTGKLHIGHYVGALQNWIRLQNDYECFFFAADWHALTTDYADTSRVKNNIFEMVFDWLAAGLDPEKATIFIQSHVPQHAELHLLLSMMTPLGWLERVPTYKDQKEQLKEKDLNTYGFLGLSGAAVGRHSDVPRRRMFRWAKTRLRTWRSRGRLRAGSISSTNSKHVTGSRMSSGDNRARD